tara:strand:+ start:211 stop:3975 length:3765 start_codon:yes stop_codon:yes gene_type:complete
MAIKVRLPNARYIKIDTDDPEYAKTRAAEYYKSGEVGFIDNKTKNMASKFDKEQFDYETGVAAPWLRAKLGAMETLGGKERVLEEAVGGEGFTRNSRGDLALTKKGLEKLGIEPNSNKNVVIDSNRMFEFGDFADFAGILGPIAGSIAGSIFTRGKLKPQFPGIKHISLKQLGTISVGTGAGAATGKAAEEAAEYVAGLQDNTPGELAKLLATEAAIGAGGELVFGLGAKVLKHTFGQKALTRGELGAEDLKQAAALSTKGIVDSRTGKTYKGAVALSAMDSPITGLLQSIAETVAKYKGRRVALRSSLITDTNNLVRSTNDLADSFDQTIENTIKMGYGDSAADLAAGQKIAGRLSTAFNDAEFKLEKANNNITKTMDDILQDFDAFSQPATTQAGNDIRELTYDSYFSWDSNQRKIYESVGKFFEIPRNIGTGLEESAVAARAGLGKQAEFIDPTPLKEYVDIMVQNAVDAAGKIDPIKAGPQLQAYQDLLNRTGKNLSLKELIELRSDLASANRITEVGQPGFATLASVQRSDMLTIIDETLKKLETGDQFAYESLQSFFTKNIDESTDAIPKLQEEIKNLETTSDRSLYQLIDDVASTNEARTVPAQKILKDLLSRQTKETLDAISTARTNLVKVEDNIIKAMDQRDLNQQILKDGIDPRYGTYNSVSLSESDRIAYQKGVDAAEQRLTELGSERIEITTVLENIEQSSDFVSLKQIAQQNIKKLERDAAYHQKVIDDITNNNKINPKKIKAQIKSIQIANNFYSKGMEAFDQAIVKNIMNDASMGGYDVDKILSQIVLKKNNGDQIKRFLETLDVDTSGFRKARIKGSGRVDRSKAPLRKDLAFDKETRKILKDADIDVKDLTFQNSEEVRGVLQREFIREIVNKTQRTGAVTNYRQIANAIEGYGTTGDILFGAGKKSELIKTLREADNIINIQDLTEVNRLLNGTSNVDHVIKDLSAKIAAQEQLTEIGKIEVFKKIQSGNIDSENIVNALFKPGNSEDIVKVRNLLGPESVEYKEFQNAAMRKMLNDYIQPGDDVIEKLFNEGKFYDAIMSPGGYGESVLKETFGDEQYKLLREAAKRSKFVVGSEKAAGGGGLFTQGLMFNIIFKPLQALPTFGIMRGLAKVLGSRKFLGWLSGNVSNKQIIEELPTILDTVGIAQPIRRSLGIQIPSEQIGEGTQYLERNIQNEGVDPKAPIAVTPLDLPEVENLSAQGGQAPISRSLLGGNPANEEIYDRRYNEINQDLQRLA